MERFLMGDVGADAAALEGGWIYEVIEVILQFSEIHFMCSY